VILADTGRPDGVAVLELFGDIDKDVRGNAAKTLKRIQCHHRLRSLGQQSDS
jgi:hypothetical protein